MKFVYLKNRLLLSIKKSCRKKSGLFFASGYYSSAFVSVLAILKTNRVFVWAFPFSTTTGASGFVFVTPDFNFGAAYVAVNICWFGL